ncbi:MAG: hypothetical protein AAGA85_07405 [Bacteroidota bacterium]
MFSIFRKKKEEDAIPQLLDLHGQPIEAGDVVTSLRYDLGDCTLELEETQYFYRSITSGQRVSYVKMVDAVTGHQKVLKKTEE